MPTRLGYYAMSGKGKASERMFEDIFKKLGKRAFVYRFPDKAEVRGRTQNGAVWMRKQPSDYLVTENGVTYYAEVKSSQQKTSFPFSKIQPYQKGSARRQVAAGGLYFFFLHNLTTGDWYKVPAEVILNSDKSSVRWADVDSYKWELAYVH